MSAPQETIWGKINTCIEIGLEIYQLCCKHNSGIAIPIDKAKTILSKKAISCGKEKDGYIYFEDTAAILAPIFELLKSAKITNNDYINKMGSIDKIQTEGKCFLPEYFGEFDPPTVSKNEKITPISNGISMITNEKDTTFSIHKTYADNVMSDTAIELGKEKEDYLYYDSITASVPIYELSKVNQEVKDLITSEDSLKATLCNNFQAYVTTHNATANETEQITKVDAPISMFMQCQLDKAVNEELIIDTGYETLSEEDIFSEEIQDDELEI